MIPFTNQTAGGLGAAGSRVMRHSDGQLCLRAHPALRRCVAHYTLTWPAAHLFAQPSFVEPSILTLLPDVSGCFVFSLAPTGVRAVMWGATTRAAYVQRDRPDTPPRFFVEFQPGGARLLTGLAMDELTDRMLPMADVVPGLLGGLAGLLEAAMADEFCLEDLLCRVDAFLLGHLRQREGLRTEEPAQAAALLPLLAGGTAPRVRDVAEASGYSERHLRRLFRAGLGVGVKTAARVLRVNGSLAGLEEGLPVSLVAQAAGYYDQAHFDHDFKAVCGVSPTAYRAAMADFYKESFKF